MNTSLSPVCGSGILHASISCTLRLLLVLQLRHRAPQQMQISFAVWGRKPWSRSLEQIQQSNKLVNTLDASWAEVSLTKEI